MIKTGLLEQVVALNKLVTRLNPGQFVPSVDAETLGCLTAFYLSKQIEDSTQVVLLREQNRRLRLFAAAICMNVARWEQFTNHIRGEICFGGLRYSTDIDESGVPIISEFVEARLAEAIGKRAILSKGKGQ